MIRTKAETGDDCRFIVGGGRHVSERLILVYCFGWLKRIMLPDGSRKAQSITP
jgi:hypothetical protein